MPTRFPLGRLFLALFVAGAAGTLRLHGAQENGSKPQGEVFVEISTVQCASVRWPILGDANRNAEIEVHYRKAGAADWRQGLSLFRCIPDPHPKNQTPEARVAEGWMFAGSVVGLEPDTEYELKVNLKDPDGGEAEKTVKTRTWKEPLLPAGLKEYHVIPGKGGGKGTAEDPLQGLDEAVKVAAPGTVFLLHKGVYVKDACEGNQWTIEKSGEEGKPIVFKAAGDGEVILDGGGLKSPERLVSAGKTRHLWFEDLIFEGKEYLVVAHEASHWVLRRCTFRKGTKGFTAHNGGYAVSQHHWISDNLFQGESTWPRSKGIEAAGAIKMSGAGHVVCNNRFEHMGDGIHGTEHGCLYACDFYQNDCHILTDDGMETDYAVFNIRAFRNRIVNVIHGITAQPIKGGPVYLFRNVIYNAVYSPFKLHNHTSGVYILHNTCLKQGSAFSIVPAGETVNNVWTRNNLFLGTGGTALNTNGQMKNCNFDNDGYGGFGSFASWNRTAYKTIEDAKQGGALYKDKGAYRIELQKCFASGLQPPAQTNQPFKGSDLSFLLHAESQALDKGVVLPGFNDGFQGQAPDLGAFELGEKEPLYGPRPKAN